MVSELRTYEVNDESTICETTGRGVEESLTIRVRGLSKGSGEATCVGVRVAEVEDRRKIARRANTWMYET